jgi:hypothetical protein
VRQGALLAAVLAVLMQMLLLPAVHRPAAVASAAAHHAAGQPAEEGAPGSAHDDHQVCHFCRLATALMSPPTPGAFAPAPVEAGPAWWPVCAPAAPDRARLGFRRVRAPPSPLPA